MEQNDVIQVLLLLYVVFSKVAVSKIQLIMLNESLLCMQISCLKGIWVFIYIIFIWGFDHTWQCSVLFQAPAQGQCSAVLWGHVVQAIKPRSPACWTCGPVHWVISLALLKRNLKEMLFAKLWTECDWSYNRHYVWNARGEREFCGPSRPDLQWRNEDG